MPPCRVQNCPNISVSHGYCSQHIPLYLQDRQVYDDNRPNANQRGYTYRWHKVSRLYLKEHPLCVICQKEGRVTEAIIVDHITPHKGNQELFWNDSNWQPLCKSCHDKKTATEK